MTSTHTFRRTKFIAGNLIVCVALLALAGCGKKLATVNGTVSYNGNAVIGGTLTFGPIAGQNNSNPGEPATATIQKDGTFKLGTHRAGDGAIIGKHRVRFTPPPQELTEAQRQDPNYIAPLPYYFGLQPKDAEIEIKPGENKLTIELIHAR